MSRCGAVSHEVPTLRRNPLERFLAGSGRSASDRNPQEADVLVKITAGYSRLGVGKAGLARLSAKGSHSGALDWI